MLGGFILPIAYDHFAADAHSGADVAEFTVAVGGLVQVHEVHVHRVPRNFLVELSVEVEQGFLQLLQAMDPHLGRRECVHPCDDTDTLVIIVGSLEHGFHFLGGVGRAFIYYFHGEFARSVQTVYHLGGVAVNGYHCVTTVQELCACHKPYFILIKCVHDKNF